MTAASLPSLDRVVLDLRGVAIGLRGLTWGFPDRKVVVMEDRTPMPKAYEPPSLTDLGNVHVLTQSNHGHGKAYGHTDGFSFTGFPLTNSS